MKTKLAPRQRITIISISEWMAHTMKQEVEVVTVLDSPVARSSYVNGPTVAHRVGTMKPRGKRKEFYLDIGIENLVLDGWDLPIQTDAEVKGGSFSGNACFNLGGIPIEGLRNYIENSNLNGPTSEDIKAKCIYVRPTDNVCDDGELMWPEIETRHAVIDRMKEKLVAA